MTNELISNSDLHVFQPAEIEQARVALGQPHLDESSAIRALIIQRDTGLSMARGEISIVPFNGKPTVMINKQGYLAYASRQPNYDGYETGVETVDGEMVVWCKVFNKNISHPVTVKIYQKEFAKTTPVWREKPRYMLEKTAISLALRAAFPILNGTYTEDEIEADAPVKIQPKPTDINVQPEPVTTKTETKPYVPQTDSGLITCSTSHPKQEPKKQPVKNFTGNICTIEEVNMRYLPIYQSQKLDLGVFTDADLGNGKFDKDMIIADYQKQVGLMKPGSAPTPAQEPEVHDEKGLDKFTAEAIEDAEREHKLKEEQQKAVENLVDAAKKAESSKPAQEPASKQTKPSATLSGDVCEVCGRKLLEADLNVCKLFTPGHKFCELHRNEYLQNKIESKVAQ